MPSSLSHVIKPLSLFLTGLDRSLGYLATPFGVQVKEARKRYAILLGSYAAIYVVGLLPIPVLPRIALAVGYIGVLAVGRAWVLNEKDRTLNSTTLRRTRRGLRFSSGIASSERLAFPLSQKNCIAAAMACSSR